ncbi:ArpU family phage transcriptional regulator [Paenibacillus sp. 4624]|uniref:ArpU family phage packaging/lysis transcriptional regulator n=1 Tax=Paenibacillus sp. 4624 TaxID=3156453 RepID=UPI003D1CF8FB
MTKKTVQLTLGLPALDSEQTRRNVEDRLETVRIYRQIGMTRREIGTTPNYSPREHGSTNQISMATQDTAIWNVDKEAELEEHSIMLDRALQKLSRKERELIERRFLEDEDVFDYNVCADMNMGERSFRRMKARAIYKLSLSLRLEVLVDPLETIDIEEKKVAAK